MKIFIKEYSSEYYEGIKEILYDNYDSNISKSDLEKYYISDCKKIYIALYENMVVGCTFLEIKNDYIRYNRYGYISYVATANNYRKLGIGRKMINSVLCRAKEMGCNTVELTSADTRTTAHQFYKALGFTRKKTTVFIKDPL